MSVRCVQGCFFLAADVRSLNLEAIRIPVMRIPVQVAKIDLLSEATEGWFTASSVKQVIRFMGTRNQLDTVARWLSGMN